MAQPVTEHTLDEWRDAILGYAWRWAHIITRDGDPLNPISSTLNNPAVQGAAGDLYAAIQNYWRDREEYRKTHPRKPLRPGEG